MAIFKCKMCGGTLEISNNETVATCEYCGTQQTLPKLDNDRRINLYDRANHFRRNNEFDKAMGIYEQILNEDNTDAEAYWSLVLCRYGIEYVEDPSSHKRIPTVNRAQFTSVFDDDNYKSALRYADGYQRHVYEEEAKAINEIQKGILAISQKEEPFDVFICYKETDNNGRRTPDSVLANDLYHQLTQEGFKVFFARITLEDKLGSAYEPYIFAALNSAKVMVVLGTRPEYFKAVWVRNEWSRYLSLIKQGQKKILIPAYKDMDPYDLPEEFSHLQAQDMGKLGFLQDLIRGIKKIAQEDTPKATVVKETTITGGSANTAPLLRRVFMFLEDGDWNSANEYCERVLDIDPENASAYLGKLMADLRVGKEESLKDCAEPFDTNNNYQKAIRFADIKLKTMLAGYIEHINTRNENTRLEGIYSRAKNVMSMGSTEKAFNAMSMENIEKAFLEAAHLFETISDYRDSATLANECYEKAENARKDAILAKGRSKMTGEDVSYYESAIELFASISGWKDADENIYSCHKKIEKIKAKEEADRLERELQAELARKEAERIAKRNKIIAAITIPIVCAIIAFVIILKSVIIPNEKYNEAIALMNAEQYWEAIASFEALNKHKDSEKQIESCKTALYDEAVSLMLAAEYEKAATVFEGLGGYKDSASCAETARCQAKKAKKMEDLKACKAGDYVIFGAYEQDNNTSNGKENIEWLVLEVKDGKVLVISKYALNCKQYNSEFTDVTWETCSLRKWLNSEFLNAAFSAEERSIIPTVTVSADKSLEYSTNPGKATQDQVFLLSIAEANKYFDSNSMRQCKPTAYAKAQGVHVDENNGNVLWWLRSPGSDQDFAARVSSVGGVNVLGGYVDIYFSAVRPALWIDLNP